MWVGLDLDQIFKVVKDLLMVFYLFLSMLMVLRTKVKSTKKVNFLFSLERKFIFDTTTTGIKYTSVICWVKKAVKENRLSHFLFNLANIS